MNLFGIALLALAAFGRPPQPKQHPVPLPANFDASQCNACHSDKTQGKVVHPAVAMGCLTCHRVRNIGNKTLVTLKTGTPATLCFECHTDKNPATLHSRIHPPAVRDCLACHDPHSSANEYLLLKPTTGATKADNLCLSCHNVGVDVPKGGSRHPALDMGCLTCHDVHKVGDPQQREFAYHLKKDAPALCLVCHNANDPALAKAHDNQPFATADCLQCHDPHQSAGPMLAQKFLHPPYAMMGCETCHTPAKDGKVALTVPDVKTLCSTCHGEQASEIATAKVPHPGAQGDCTVCHSPHAGNSPAFLQSNPVAVCLNCHTDLAAQGQKAYPHVPAFGQGCAICHQPHGSPNANLLRTSDINSLCLECHGPQSRPQPVKGTNLEAIFNGKVELPTAFFRKVPILPLTNGMGHPIANHPTSGTVKLKDKTVQMNCLSCHQPHASSKPDLLVNDEEPNMAFCNRCHTTGTMPQP